jgi:hypothetical protein
VENHLELDYVGAGIRVTIDPAGAAFGADPAAAFRQMASDLGIASTSVQTVDNVPALVVAPSAGQPGFVDMDLNGIRVAVIGEVPVATLVSVANSIG